MSNRNMQSLWQTDGILWIACDSATEYFSDRWNNWDLLFHAQMALCSSFNINAPLHRLTLIIIPTLTSYMCFLADPNNCLFSCLLLNCFDSSSIEWFISEFQPYDIIKDCWKKFVNAIFRQDLSLRTWPNLIETTNRIFDSSISEAENLLIDFYLINNNIDRIWTSVWACGHMLYLKTWFERDVFPFARIIFLLEYWLLSFSIF